MDIYNIVTLKKELDIIQQNVYKKTEQTMSKKKIYNDVITDLVTNEILKTKTQNLKFLKLIFDTFNEAIKIYNQQNGYSDKDILFVFKGGNVLRFITTNIIDELPGIVSNEIKKNYDKHFTKSDADFSIIINPDLPTFEKIREDLKFISYHLLDYIRNTIMENIDEYFYTYVINEKTKLKLFNKTLEKLNKLSEKQFLSLTHNDITYGEKHNFIPQIRQDFYITSNDDVNILKKIRLSNNNDMYISINDTLKFKSDNYTAHYDLIRMKMNCPIT